MQVGGGGAVTIIVEGAGDPDLVADKVVQRLRMHGGAT